MNNKKSLSTKSVLAYGAGGFGRQATSIIQATFLLYYFVNVVGLKATYVGIMMMFAKVWDAINDPIMGTIVDNTHSKYGKVRPYLLYSSVPLAIFFTAMFAIPQGLSTTGKMIWATVAYVGTGMLLTMVEVPSQTLMVRMTDSSSDRMRLSRSKTVIGNFGVILPPILIPLITSKSKNEWLAYALCVGAFSILFAACYLTVFAGTRETNAIDNEGKLKVTDSVKTLVSNKYYRKYAVSYLLYGCSYATTNGVLMFYLTARYHNATLTGVLTGIMMVGMLGAAIVAKNMADRYGKIKTSLFGLTIACGGMLLRVVTADAGIPILIIGIFCYGVGASLYIACLQPMVSETVDYGELKSGVRVESLSFAGLTLISKIGEGIATAMVAVLLDLIGYIDGAAEQTGSAIAGLRHIGSTLPLIFVGVIVIIFLNNDMDKKYAGYKAELKEKRMLSKKEVQ